MEKTRDEMFNPTIPVISDDELGIGGISRKTGKKKKKKSKRK